MRGSSMGRTMAVTAALVPLFLVGCDEGGGTGPEDVDLSTTAVAMEETVEDYLLQNKAILSITALAGAMSDACGGGASLGAGPDGVYGLLDVVGGRAPRALLRGDPEAIAEQCLGQSLVMNPATGEYETGGPGSVPANGVRFELYDVDSNGTLITPLDAIGYVEIVDNSTETTIAGSFEAVVDGATLIDFAGEITGAATALNMAADGFFSNDGSSQLVVTMDAGFDIQSGDVSASVELETDDLTATISFEGDAAIESEEITGSFDARVENGDAVVVFDGDVDADSNVSGNVLVNGQVVASFSVNSETQQLTLTDQSDGALTDADLAALESMFQSAITGMAAIVTVGLLLFLLSGGL